MLGLIALLGLKPWEADSVEPRLGPLGFEMAVGDSVALRPAPAAFVADAAVAPGKAKPVAAPATRSGNDVGSPAALAVAPARAVVFAEVPSSPASPAPESGTGDEVPSGGATNVEAPPEGTSSPVAIPVSTGGGASGGPITSGAGPVSESCEGDEYLLTITFLDEESVSEESPVEIVLQRLNEDGSVDELRLEGDLSDARSLVLKLSSEGSCVQVEVEQPEEEEVPEAGEEEAGPAELPEPVSP